MGPTLELKGVLAASDPRGRLRLHLVESLAAEASKPDNTWRQLQRIHGPGPGAPYRLNPRGSVDSAGFRGECWLTVPKNQRSRVEECARALRGREVQLEARPRYYRCAGAGAGERVEGVYLMFMRGLEEARPVELLNPPRTPAPDGTRSRTIRP